MQNIQQNHFQCKIIQKAFHSYRNKFLYYLYFHHCNDWVKTIPPSNIFLLSYSLKYFKRTQTSTTVLIRRLRLRYNKSNIKYIFCNKRLMAFLVSQMSKDKPSRLLPIKSLLFWCGGLSSSYKKLCFSVQSLFSTSVTTSH